MNNKNNSVKKIFMLIAILIICLVGLLGCSTKKEKIVIYTSAEDYRVEYMQKRLNQTFPDYNIIIEYMPTGNHAAKLLAEGEKTECDITYDLEYSYMEKLSNQGLLSDLDYDFSIYQDDAVNGKYLIPVYRNGGAIIINPKVISEKGLSNPTCYEDLLKPEYKDLISMPNPKSSGTGYMFLKSLVNVWGEESAFKYFEKLTENILQYTSSGSGPVNALIQGEVAIGLGMTGQAVTTINNGTELEIVYFEEGSPFCLYGQGIINGKENRNCVKEVFDFMVNVFTDENCANFFPEPIYKYKTYKIENYPTNIKYANMDNNTMTEKERLLEKWLY